MGFQSVIHPNGTFGYFSRIDIQPSAAQPIAGGMYDTLERELAR